MVVWWWWKDERSVTVVELELEALPLSRLVVEFRQPPLLDTEEDSTVPMLALLSSPGLSRPGLCKAKQRQN